MSVFGRNKRCEVIWADDDRKKATERLERFRKVLEDGSVADPKGLPEILKTIQDAIFAGRRQSESEMKEDRKKQLKDAADDLAKLVPLYESVMKYSGISDSFKSITVVSARLSFELAGTMKDASGEAVKLTEVVDVVNFDDSKQDSKKQPKAEKNGGNQ